MAIQNAKNKNKFVKKSDEIEEVFPLAIPKQTATSLEEIISRLSSNNSRMRGQSYSLGETLQRLTGDNGMVGSDSKEEWPNSLIDQLSNLVKNQEAIIDQIEKHLDVFKINI